MAAPPRAPLAGSRAPRRNRFEDIRHYRVGAKLLGQDGEPVAPDPRAIAAGKADDHVGIVAQARGRRVHKNKMRTNPATSSPGTLANQAT